MRLRMYGVATALLISCSDSNTGAPVATGFAGQQAAQQTTPSAGSSAAAAAAGKGASGSSGYVAGASGTLGASGAAARSGAGAVAGQVGGLAGSPAVAGSFAATAGAAGIATAGAGAVAGSSAGAGVAGAAGAGTIAGAGGSAAGASGASGQAGSSATVAEAMGCSGTKLLAVPEDTSERGPWPIGERTVAIGRLSAVEVFYPAQLGSETGKDPITFDARDWLPKSERSKVPDSEATIINAGTFRDLPIDAEHGPYPVVIFVHGTASMRIGSLSSQSLWASRGFIVVAADHPGLCLADSLAPYCGQTAPAENLSADVDAELSAVTQATGDLAFLSGHVDSTRVGLSGHSAGAVAIAGFSTKPGVQVVMPLAGTSAVSRSSTLKSVLFVAGMDDQVLSYGPGGSKFGNLLYPGSDVDAYNASPTPRRLIGLSKGGHLNVTDLCHVNAQGKSDVQVASDHGVCGVASVVMLADCGSIDAAKAIQITNAATTAVLEGTLQCQDRSAAISGLKARFPEIGDFQEAN